MGQVAMGTKASPERHSIRKPQERRPDLAHRDRRAASRVSDPVSPTAVCSPRGLTARTAPAPGQMKLVTRG